MWCSECNKEYDNVSVCPDCGAELREMPELSWGGDSRRGISDRWPVGDGGEPVAPAFLRHCTGFDMDDGMLVSMLEAYGIPAVRRYPGNGEFGRLILGMSGEGVDVFVPETMLEDAIALTEGAPDV